MHTLLGLVLRSPYVGMSSAVREPPGTPQVALVDDTTEMPCQALRRNDCLLHKIKGTARGIPQADIHMHSMLWENPSGVHLRLHHQGVPNL